ncbi:hypothetical protein BSKO_03737 [Bryopsis sp. KO-2023]|nr:hypothetical protein BSKO_03737 [Bryopsis sp. KO-2023]
MRLVINRGKDASPGSATDKSEWSSGYGEIFVQRIDETRSDMALSLPSLSETSHGSGGRTVARDDAPASIRSRTDKTIVPGYHCSEKSFNGSGLSTESSRHGIRGGSYSDLIGGNSSRNRFRRTIVGSSIHCKDVDSVVEGRRVSGVDDAIDIDRNERIAEFTGNLNPVAKRLERQCGDLGRPADNLMEACSRSLKEALENNRV